MATQMKWGGVGGPRGRFLHTSHLWLCKLHSCCMQCPADIDVDVTGCAKGGRRLRRSMLKETRPGSSDVASGQAEPTRSDAASQARYNVVNMDDSLQSLAPMFELAYGKSALLPTTWV